MVSVVLTPVRSPGHNLLGYFRKFGAVTSPRNIIHFNDRKEFFSEGPVRSQVSGRLTAQVMEQFPIAEQPIRKHSFWKMSSSVTEILVLGLDKHWPSFPSSALYHPQLPETIPHGYSVTLSSQIFLCASDAKNST